MRRCLLVIHIGASLYLVHWTALLASGAGLGAATIMIPLQMISVCCLLGIVYAAGARPNHWTRRYLGWLNLGAVAAALLWTMGYSEGPIYRVFAGGAITARIETIVGIIVAFGLVAGISMWFVRRSGAATDQPQSRKQGLIAVSVFVWASGSLPWLWIMANTPDPVQRSYAWSSATTGLMEIATVIAICVAGFQLVRGYRLSVGVAFAEALVIPIVVRLAGW